ncbi:hypothetical protein GF362_02970 [Candidatus Dojkabacteria bacterium]|nr:hypothetical protein [Candidatus Dojkabacteria bacterium]
MIKKIQKIINKNDLKRKRKKFKVIYPAYSKQKFFLREHISKFILEKKLVPLNPFMNFNYFFGDTISRKLIYDVNDNLIRLANELWVFDKVSDGVAAEIYYCEKELKIPVRYFKIKKDPKTGFYQFDEIQETDIKVEKNSSQI